MDKLKWDAIGVEELKLVLDQGEKLLKETIDTSSIQMQRVLVILRSIIALLVILVGYLISNRPSLSIVYAEAILFAILSIIILIFSFRAYRSYQVYPMGDKPSNILDAEVLEKAGDKKMQWILFNRCRSIDSLIDTNHSSNEERGKVIKSIEQWIKWTVVTILIFPFGWYLVLQCVFGQEVF